MAIVLDPVNGITQASWTTAGRPASPSAGQVGFNTSLNSLEQYTGSAWQTIPSWTTANRPSAPVAGYQGYNTSLSAFEFYNGTTWVGFNSSIWAPVTVSYLVVGLVVAVLFVLWEKRAVEPILPLHLFCHILGYNSL